MRHWKTWALILLSPLLGTGVWGQLQGVPGVKEATDALGKMLNPVRARVPSKEQFLNDCYSYGAWWGTHDDQFGVADKTLVKRPVPSEGEALYRIEMDSLLGDCFSWDDATEREALGLKPFHDPTLNQDPPPAHFTGDVSLGLLAYGYLSRTALLEAIHRFDDGYKHGYYAASRARRIRNGVIVSVATALTCLVVFAIARDRRRRKALGRSAP